MSCSKKAIKIAISFFICFIALNFHSIPTFCWAESVNSEHILDYNSNIIINKDSTMDVTETITVQAEGINIKHGIYRDFPTRYKDYSGKNHYIDFNVTSVQKDNLPESFRTTNISNGVRVYIGKSDNFLTPGKYKYSIKYRTAYQIGFFKDHDELYWNVTGNGWDFPIDHASATVILPARLPLSSLLTDGYTGPQGSTAKDFVSKVNYDGTVSFETTSSLASKEELTIAVAWPKGIVTKPSGNSIMNSLKHAPYSFLPITTVTIVLIYFLLAWIVVGKDPRKGTIIPLFYPPEGFSPASIRYIRKMAFDYKALACSIISMAVKGFITIEETDTPLVKSFSIARKDDGDESVLSPEEKSITKELISNTFYFAFKDSNYSQIKSSKKQAYKNMRERFSNNYFNTNKLSFFIGLFLSIIGLFLSIFYFANQGMLTTITIIALVIFLGYPLYQIGSLFLSECRMASTGSKLHLIISVFMSVFFIGIFACNMPSVFTFSLPSSYLLLCAVALLIINVAFWFLLKAPTRAGRELLDKIEGFKMYLSCTKKYELDFSTPPEETPELFEKYLPYALALDVENKWAEKFSDILAQAAQNNNYCPSWYVGTSWSATAATGFVSSLGNSFSNSIAASSIPPGSSSGFTGGSSGGGGGGGGGGGW